MYSIIHYLEHWAAVQPDCRLAVFLDHYGNETESYTYSEFHQRTAYLADYLSEQHGIKRGARVLLVYPPGLEVGAAFFACARIGAIPVPVCPPTTLGFVRGLARLAFIARDCQALIALTTRRYDSSYRKLCDENRVPFSSQHDPEIPAMEWIGTDSLRGVPSQPFKNQPGPVLFLQYTSGSTSNPKGVIVSHENIIHNGRSTVDHKAIGVSWLPHYHDMGLIGYHLHPVIVGATVYSFSPLDFLKRPLLWLETMSRVQATYASSPNFGFEYCLRDEKIPAAHLDSLDLRSMRVLMNASEIVQPDTCVRFRERFVRCGLRPEAVVGAYGLAENTLAATHYGRRIIALNRRPLRQGTTLTVDDRPSHPDHLRFVSCGKPLDGVRLRVVHPESKVALGPMRIGEIWLSGKSTCCGYWNRRQLTAETFHNHITNDAESADRYLRTGDLGFLYEDELFVCGRIKELIVIRGINYYPEDIELAVKSSSPKIRAGGVAAFNGNQDQDTLVIIVEVKSAKDLPDASEIAHAIRTRCSVDPYEIIFVPTGTIVRTTSGKTARSLTRLRWLNGDLQTIAIQVFTPRKQPAENPGLRARFLHLLEQYRITGKENCTFADLGINSLDLVTLLLEIEQTIEDYSINLANQFDVWVIQCMTVADFFSLLDRLEGAPATGEAALCSLLEQVKHDFEVQEKALIRSDVHLNIPARFEILQSADRVANVLLTGPTGFFGPFLLNSLLRRTPYTYYVLTRALNPNHGMDRIRASLNQAGVWSPSLDEELKRRVQVLCGDIAQPNCGLCPEQWVSVAASVQAILHNAAAVNYVLSYRALKPHNVDGTRELLRLCFMGTPKEFHLISSTTIFGWTQRAEVMETERNDNMVALDFGYAQTKWAAEQLVFAAAQQGINIRIYRPAFLSPSTAGAGSRNDIALLLLAFMIKHGLGVKTLNQISFLPVDLAADNAAAIFSQPHAAATTFHLTADYYYNMADITRLITLEHGYQFSYHEIEPFVAEVNRRCAKDDPLFPLLPFINRSYPKIAAMQHKRYNNDQYRKARPSGYADPALKDVVSHLMGYLLGEGMIPSRIHNCSAEFANRSTSSRLGG
jgi:thioester reductase-like protein